MSEHDDISEARDPLVPVDPESGGDRDLSTSSKNSTDGFEFHRTDLGNPYRIDKETGAGHVFVKGDGWYRSSIHTDDLWPATEDELAGDVGGRNRLTEPIKGYMPVRGPKDDTYANPNPVWLQEADSSADLPDTDDDGLPSLAPLPQGGMTEEQIRDAGLRIDIPYETGGPKRITYKDTGQKEWVPPPGWLKRPNSGGGSSS